MRSTRSATLAYTKIRSPLGAAAAASEAAEVAQDLLADDTLQIQLDEIIKGMFDAAGKLYGLEFVENTGSVPVFHPDVRTYEIRRNGKVLGLHYLVQSWKNC